MAHAVNKVLYQDKPLVLRSKFNEYNCAVKMCGRLYLEHAGKDLDGWFSNDLVEFLQKNKTEIIKELGQHLTSKNTYTQLLEKNNMFPMDSGTYLPSYLLYADRIVHKGDLRWWSEWPGLIQELETHPEHGFKVFKLPAFINNFYKSSFCASRVWGIVPPAFNKLVVTQETKDYLKEKYSLSNSSIQALGMPETDTQDIKQILGL